MTRIQVVQVVLESNLRKEDEMSAKQNHVGRINRNNKAKSELAKPAKCVKLAARVLACMFVRAYKYLPHLPHLPYLPVSAGLGRGLCRYRKGN
jgi:hypothetical protein